MRVLSDEEVALVADGLELAYAKKRKQARHGNPGDWRPLRIIEDLRCEMAARSVALLP